MIGLLHNSSRVANRRSGATLTEVLMAILIMSIGVTSVFTLFPISIVRSIKASQQTNASLLKQNITELIRLKPGLLYQHATPAALTSGNTPADRWQASNFYGLGDVIAADLGTGAVPQLYGTLGVNVHGNAFPPTGYPTLPGGTIAVSGPDEPKWLLPVRWPIPFNDGIYTDDTTPPPNPTNGINWNPTPQIASSVPLFTRTLDTVIQGDPSGSQIVWVPFPGHFSNPNANGYVVDPLGFWEIFDSEGSNAIAASEFGKRVDRTGVVPASPNGNPSDAAWNSVPGWGTAPNGNISSLPRINGGIRAGTAATPNVATSIAAARSFFGLPDTWAANNSTTVTAATLVAAAPPTIPPNTFDFDLPNNFKDVPLPGSGSRLVLTTEEGQSFATANYAITQTVPSYTVRARLPSGFISATTGIRVTQVRFESQETRYTWLATVNNTKPGSKQVKIAVFFNRKFTLGEEHVYMSVWGDAEQYYGPVASGGNGQGAPWSNQVDYSSAHPGLGTANTTVLGENQVLLAWDDSSTPAGEPTPIVSEGDYVLDAVNVDWYKVVDVPAAPSGAGNKKYYILTLDQPVRVPTLNANAALPQSGVGRLILFRGLVGLYDLTN